MKRIAFQASVKYSWTLNTVDFARLFRRRISSDKLLGRGCWGVCARAGCDACCRARRGQGMCRLLILPAMPLSISRDRLEKLLDSAAATRIVAVGDAMLDEYLLGDVDRISPEAPVPVVRVRD